MAVGAIGGFNAASFQPYIYNTNRLDRSSLNRIEPLPEDGTKNAGVDFSGVAGQDEENVNALRQGQTQDFQGVLDMQFAMGRQNAARIFAENAPEVAAQAAQTEQAGAQAQEQLNEQAVQARQQQALDPTVQGVA